MFDTRGVRESFRLTTWERRYCVEGFERVVFSLVPQRSVSPKLTIIRVSDCRSIKTAKSNERLPKALPAFCLLLTGEEKELQCLCVCVREDPWWGNWHCCSLGEKIRVLC